MQQRHILPPLALRSNQSNRWTTTSKTVAVAMTSEESAEKDDEIERLRSMAAKLRAEAAALEADQAQEMATAAEQAFQKFDKDRDGEISMQELKEGLEKAFKMELSEKRVKQLMEDFDKSGDGALQLEEFVGVDKFRNKLDALAREERAVALEKARVAKLETDAYKTLEEQVGRINDRPPSNTDKIISVLPYLFPLLDGLEFGRFLILGNPDNVVSGILAVMFALYKSIPFGGFIAFFALLSLSGNPGINRLIRFNMQQAIYLDIALFFPGLIAALVGLITKSTGGGGVPLEITVLGNDAIFLTMLACVGYCMVSSILGIVPDKIPLISDAVSNRVPTADKVLDDTSSFFGLKKDKKDEDDKKKD